VTLAAAGTRGVIEMDMFAQYLIRYDDRVGRIKQVLWGGDSIT